MNRSHLIPNTHCDVSLVVLVDPLLFVCAVMMVNSFVKKTIKNASYNTLCTRMYQCFLSKQVHQTWK